MFSDQTREGDQEEGSFGRGEAAGRGSSIGRGRGSGWSPAEGTRSIQVIWNENNWRIQTKQFSEYLYSSIERSCIPFNLKNCLKSFKWPCPYEKIKWYEPLIWEGFSVPGSTGNYPILYCFLKGKFVFCKVWIRIWIGIRMFCSLRN